MKHTISVLVDNKPGVLARISGLFSARGFNIDSLAVGQTNDPTMSRMTIVVDAADERILDQIKKQLQKLIDIITVEDLSSRQLFARELVLVKVEAPGAETATVKQLFKSLAVDILEMRGDEAMVQIVGDAPRIAAVLAKVAEKTVIKELVRTGSVALAW